MVALLGFVVTIGVLVVQQATGTLSPRFMRLWYRDLLQKVVLATFVGTLTLSLWLLRHVEGNSVPNIGVTVAGAAASASLLLLLYLNRFTHSLRPVAVAAAVSRAGRRVVESSPVGQAASEDLDGALRGVLSAERSMLVRVDRPGAIQAIHLEGLVAVAHMHDCVLVLRHSVGDFVPTGASVVEVFGSGPFPRARRLRRMFALGRERTIEQDPAFALRVLVDIAIRALSPAVNDPTTAVQVLDYIEDLLLAIGRRESAGCGEFRDADGRLRVLAPVRRWEDFLELGVTEIRRYGATAVQVTRRLRDHDIVRLVDLLFVTKDADGRVSAVERSDLSKEELQELGALAGALAGLGAAGEEGLEPGAEAGAETMAPRDRVRPGGGMGGR